MIRFCELGIPLALQLEKIPGKQNREILMEKE